MFGFKKKFQYNINQFSKRELCEYLYETGIKPIFDGIRITPITYSLTKKNVVIIDLDLKVLELINRNDWEDFIKTKQTMTKQELCAELESLGLIVGGFNSDGTLKFFRNKPDTVCNLTFKDLEKYTGITLLDWNFYLLSKKHSELKNFILADGKLININQINYIKPIDENGVAVYFSNGNVLVLTDYNFNDFINDTRNNN